jgi:tRNA U34 5-carboxymethylaminomethyl modifying GTPase MnmE/TrmE
VNKGAVRNQFEGLRRDIINSLAMIEALIDFSESDGIDDDIYEKGVSDIISC